MLDTYRFQQTIIAALKADTPLMLALGTGSVHGAEVREDNYQGADWLFPAVRVAVDEAVRVGNPDCGHWQVTFRTYVVSEKDSSAQMQQILKLAGEALDGRAVSATGSYTGLRITPVTIRPHRLAQMPDSQINTWYGEDVWNQYVIEKL